MHQAVEHAEIVREVGRVVAVEASEIPGRVDRMGDQAAGDRRPDRMHLELERRHDPEVSAAAAKRPVQVRVLAGARRDDIAGRRDHLGREQIVSCEAVLRHQPTECRRRVSGRRRRVVETVPPVTASPWSCASRLSSAQVTPGSTRAVRDSGSTWTPRISERSIIIPPSHTACPATPWPPPRTAISNPLSRAALTAATTSAVPRTSGDNPRVAVDHPVEYPPGILVPIVSRSVQRSAEPVECFQHLVVGGDSHGDSPLDSRFVTLESIPRARSWVSAAAGILPGDLGL